MSADVAVGNFRENGEPAIWRSWQTDKAAPSGVSAFSAQPPAQPPMFQKQSCPPFSEGPSSGGRSRRSSCVIVSPPSRSMRFQRLSQDLSPWHPNTPSIAAPAFSLSVSATALPSPTSPLAPSPPGLLAHSLLSSSPLSAPAAPHASLPFTALALARGSGGGHGPCPGHRSTRRRQAADAAFADDFEQQLGEALAGISTGGVSAPRVPAATAAPRTSAHAARQDASEQPALPALLAAAYATSPDPSSVTGMDLQAQTSSLGMPLMPRRPRTLSIMGSRQSMEGLLALMSDSESQRESFDPPPLPDPPETPRSCGSRPMSSGASAHLLPKPPGTASPLLLGRQSVSSRLSSHHMGLDVGSGAGVADASSRPASHAPSLRTAPHTSCGPQQQQPVTPTAPSAAAAAAAAALSPAPPAALAAPGLPGLYRPYDAPQTRRPSRVAKSKAAGADLQHLSALSAGDVVLGSLTCAFRRLLARRQLPPDAASKGVSGEDMMPEAHRPAGAG